MARRSAASDKEYTRRWKRADRATKRAFLFGFAHRVGCVDCGEKDPRVLEFDHRDRGGKLRNVAHLVSFNYSLDAIEKEIAKCEVRCANCHRLRTAEQMGWYKDFDQWLQ